MTLTPYPGDTDWPSDFQGCTFTGTYVGLDGAPVNGDVDPNGYVQFICPVEVLLSFGTYKVILPRSLRVQLDAHGHFSILVPATDDPDISPIGWTYTIHEAFSGGRSYSVEAPLGQTVDITRASPVPDAKGNPVVRGPRGVDGLIQGASLNGDLLPVDDASDIVLDGYVLDLRQSLADIPNPAEALLHLGVTGDLITRDASEFDAAGAAADALTEADLQLAAFQAGLAGLETIKITDWDTVAAQGLYFGDSTAANAPAAHNYAGFALNRTDIPAGGITVLAVRTTTIGDAPEVWVRNGVIGGAWNAWHQVAGAPVWTNLPVLAAYNAAPTTAQYAKVGGILSLRGVILKNVGNIAAGALTPLTTALPTTHRPTRLAQIRVAVADGSFANSADLVVGSDGVIYVSLPADRPGIWVDGINIQVP